MPGKNSEKRSQALAVRCARLRRQGQSLSEIAAATGVDKAKLPARIQLGERLLSVTV